MATFGDVIGHHLTLLAEDDHGKVGGLVLAVADADIKGSEGLLPILGLPRLGVLGRVADDDQFLVIRLL
jgi:hypothetical protein